MSREDTIQLGLDLILKQEAGRTWKKYHNLPDLLNKRLRACGTYF